ncbi:MAG: NAD(P)H-hydrate epimerase, partial [Gemmatimonadaceae bacterium]
MELERAANRRAVVAHRMPVRVAGAAESAEIDAAAIASGIPSRALMRVAAANAATVIAARAARGERGARSGGVIVYTGRGNNGGDGWAVARSLAMAGCHVVVREIVSAATPDAIAERDAYRACCANASDDEYSGSVIVDAMLGTGSAGEPRGAIAAAVNAVNALRSRGATVVSLDVPTGLDATSGAGELTVHADLTLNFGTCKRGALAARGRCGELIVLDIGLETNDEQLPLLVDVEYVRANVPKVPATAHKGTRGKLAVVAGARGMGGAAILAAKGALLSGIGLLKVVTDDCNVTSVHAQVPEALTGSLTDAAGAIAGWADAVLIGPGLGHDANARALVLDILQAWRGPVVVDADALNVFDNNVAALASLLAGRSALITPHPAELGRLLGRDVEDVLANRFDIAVEVARTLG